MAIINNDFNALQTRIKNILGVGAGDSGYGQTLKSAQLQPLALILQSNFQNLIDDIRAARYHQIGGVTPLIPDAPTLMTTTIWNKMLSVMTDVEKNKLAIPPVSQATRTPLSSEVTPNDTWNSTTTHKITIQFDDENHMRYYFNSGGTVEFSATSTNTSSNLKSKAWNSLLASIGVVSFKHNATTSTKAVGTTFGFKTLTTIDQVIFTKSITDTPSPNYYTITASKDTQNFLVNFTITFTNSGANVTSILESTVNAYHASGNNVAVTAPDAASIFTPGLANPVFALSRSVAKINEGETDAITGDLVGVTFTLTTQNFSDSLLYWSIIGSKITAADFTPASLTGSFEVLSNSGTFNIVAAADTLTEGVEQFNVQIRTDNNPKSPVVAQLSSLEIIADLSTTPAAPTYTILPLDSTTVNEGDKVTYRVVTTNVPDGTILNWSTKLISPTLNASDFVDNRLTGTITINGNNAELVRTILSDPLTEFPESYQIVLSYVNPTTKISKTVQTSQTVTISDPVVVAPIIPYTVTNDVYSVPEDSTNAVIFTVHTPMLPSNTKLYWRVVTDTGSVTASDFTDNTLTGSVVISQSTGSIVKKAKKDTFTEGDESFHLAFYSDSLMTKWLVDSDDVTISESVPYVLTRTPNSMNEAGTIGAIGFGVTFTLTTPKLPNGTILYWTTVSEAGNVIATDFTDNAIDGSVVIMNNTGTILRRAAVDNLTEGTEQFQLEIRATAGTSSPVLVSSQTTSITETVKYEIIPQTALIVENQIGVEFIIKTPFLKDGTLLYWDTLVDTGAITATDFTDNRLSGTVTINSNTGSITRTAIQDNLTEGKESFHLILKTGPALGTKVAESTPVVISEVVPYTIVPTVSAFVEGQSGITFNITTPSVANGAKVYWTTLRHAGNITADDFIVSDAQGGSAQRLNGYAVVTNNKASFILSGRPDSITEGSETFQIEIRIDSITGPVQATTNIITLTEIVPYRVVPNVTSVNEGSSVSFAVTTPNLIDGTTLYWTTHTNSGTINVTDKPDFTNATQGTVIIKNNAGTIIRTVSADIITEGVDAFSIELRSESYTGTILVTSGVVTINDTSGTPAEVIPDEPTYAIVPNKAVVVEGDIVTFNIFTTNVAPATSLYWTLFKGPGLTDSFFTPSSSVTAIHVAYDNPGSSDTSGHAGVTITVASNVNIEADRVFIFELRTGSVAGTVVATSSVPVKVVDQTPYMVYANTSTLVEGSLTGVTFTVTTPAAAYGTNLTWAVVADTGTVDGYDLSPGASGTVAINSSGTGTFLMSALANAPVEGNEKFHITLASAGGTPISLGAGSPVITIVENTPYLLTANPTSVDEGSPVTFTFSTPKLDKDVSYTWTINTKTGIFESTDFSPASLTGTVTVPSSTSSQTFTVTTVNNDYTDGTRQFYLDMALTSTGQQIVLGSSAPVITITETIPFTIMPDTTSITEGAGQITFTVECPKLDSVAFPYTTTVIPTVAGSITSADFYEKTLSPAVQVFIGTSGKFALTPLNDNLTKGDRTFVVRINTPTAPYPVTPLITIKDPVTPVTPVTPGGTWTLISQSANFDWGQDVGEAVEGLELTTQLVTTKTSLADRTIRWFVKFEKNGLNTTRWRHIFANDVRVAILGIAVPVTTVNNVSASYNAVTGKATLSFAQFETLIDFYALASNTYEWVGSYVKVTGFTVSAYNGTFIVSSASFTSITVTLPDQGSAVILPASGGKIERVITGTVVLPANETKVLIKIPTIDNSIYRATQTNYDNTSIPPEIYTDVTLELECTEGSGAPASIVCTQPTLRVLSRVSYSVESDADSSIVVFGSNTKIKYTVTVPWYDTRTSLTWSYDHEWYNSYRTDNSPPVSGILTKVKTGSLYSNAKATLIIDVDDVFKSVPQMLGSRRWIRIQPYWAHTTFHATSSQSPDYLATPVYPLEMIQKYPAFTVTATPSYSVVPKHPITDANLDSLLSGDTVVYKVTTPASDLLVPGKTTLYWKLTAPSTMRLPSVFFGLNTPFGSIPVATGGIAVNVTSISFTATTLYEKNVFIYLSIGYTDLSVSGSTPLKLVSPCPPVELKVSELPVSSSLSISSVTSNLDPYSYTVNMPVSNADNFYSAANGYVNTGLLSTSQYGLTITVALTPVASAVPIRADIISANASVVAAIRFFNLLVTDKQTKYTLNNGVVYFEFVVDYRADIKQSDTFTVKFTNMNDNTTKSTNPITLKVTSPPLPTFNQLITLYPANILTTETSTLTISNGDTNTAYTLSITGPKPTSGNLSTGTHSGNLTNGGVKLILGPWNSAGNVAVHATFADKTTKQSPSINVSAPPAAAETMTLTKDATSITVGSEIAPQGTPITISCSLSNVKSTSTIKCEIVDASNNSIATSLLIKIGTSVSAVFPQSGNSTLNPNTTNATFSISVYAQLVANLTAGTFKIKMSTIDHNTSAALFVTTSTINFVVPELYTESMTITPNSIILGSTIVPQLKITGGKPSGPVTILVEGTGSIASNSAYFSGTLDQNGEKTLNLSQSNISNGPNGPLPVGAGTGVFTAVFVNNRHKVTANLTITDTSRYVTVRYDNSGYVTLSPTASILNVEVVGGGGGKGRGNLPSSGDKLVGTISGVSQGGTFSFVVGDRGGDFPSTYIGGFANQTSLGCGGLGQNGVDGWQAYASGAGGGASAIFSGPLITRSVPPLCVAAGGAGGGGNGKDTTGCGGRATTFTTVAAVLTDGENGITKSGDGNTGGAGGGGGGAPGGLCGEHGNSSHDGSNGGYGGCSYVPSTMSRTAGANAGDGYISITYKIANAGLNDVYGTYIQQTISAKTFSSPGTYSWVVPKTKTSVTITVQGSGGGGSAGSCNWVYVPGSTTKKIFTTVAGYSGGAGGASFLTVSVNPGQTLTITIPEGGAGGDGTKLPTAGAATTVVVGSTTVTAAGGGAATNSAAGAGGTGTLNAGANGTAPSPVQVIYNQSTMSTIPAYPVPGELSSSGGRLAGVGNLLISVNGSGGRGGRPYTAALGPLVFPGSSGGNGWVKIAY